MHLNAIPLLLVSAVCLQALLPTPWLRSAEACPTDMCVCKWKNGKQTAECSNRQLSDLPGGLDVGTQVLNFTGNALTDLKAEWFYQLSLLNLQKIFLMRNEITRIHSRAFHGLSNLVELDLSDNHLTAVPSDSFADYGSLMRLALNGNPIRALRSSAFKHLPFLTTLELTNCQIEVVESEAFIGMDNLEWLRLDGNRIKTIRGAHLLPESLHGISLQGNRWTCDCSMVDLHRWLSTSTVPQTEEPKCVQPTRLAGSTIRSVDKGQLACLPEITPTSLSLEIAENRNLTLTCKVEATPAATISWWFQGRALENHTIIGSNIHLLMTFTMEQGEPEKRIDLFISNTTADTNGTFVCTAENAAGRVQANYTVRVIGKEEPVVEQVKFPFEYYLMFVAGAAGMGIIVLIIVCIVIVKCCCQRRRQGRRADHGGGSDGSNGHWKKAHFANGDGQSISGSGGGNGGGVGGAGNVTLITDKVMVGPGVGVGATIGSGGPTAIIGPEHQLSGGGGLCYGNKQDVIMYVSSGLMPSNGGDQRGPGGLSEAGGLGDVMQQQIAMGNRLATVSSATASPPHMAGGRNYTPDPINPDLINDTEKQRLTATLSCNGAAPISSNGSSNSNNNSNSINMKSGSQTNLALFCNTNNNNNGANMEEVGKLREFVSQSYTRPGMQHTTHLGTLPRTRLLSADHHHQADVHLNPGCFLAPHQTLNGVEHPVEYSLTNVMAVLPPNRQLVPGQQPQQQQQLQILQQIPAQQQPQSMNFTYRTLPHRMKIRNGASSPTNGVGPGSANSPGNGPLRLSRDAEFLTTLPHQAHSFDMYTPANVRYTAEGYPYTAIGNFIALPPLPNPVPGGIGCVGGAGGHTTIATTQQVQVAAFQDPSLQFLPSPPEGYKTADSDTGECSNGGSVWPPCLPGYHQHSQGSQTPTGGGGSGVPTSQIVPIKTNFAQRFSSPLASPASSVTSSTSSKLSTSTNTTTQSSSTGGSNSAAPLNVISTGNQTSAVQLPLHTPPPPVITKRCVAAQTSSMMMCGGGGGVAGGGCLEESSSCGGSGVGRRIGVLASASTLNDVDETEEETEDGDEEQHRSSGGHNTTTCRHLNGPLADSPDEGYVGDSGHDGNGSSE